MKPALTPIEHASEALAPSTVHYDIRVVWPDGQPSSYEAFSLPIAQAIEKLEVLVDELRASVKADSGG
jgi:hypothetical protein